MADFTTYPNGEPIGRASGANAPSLPAFTVYQGTYNADEGNVTNGDTCTEFIKIPAGSYVLGVAINVLTAEAAVTIDVGDVTDPNGYVVAASAAATGRAAGAGAYVAADTDVTAMQIPQFYAVDTWISFTVAGADALVATFRVSVMVANAG